jgi:predicted kinase
MGGSCRVYLVLFLLCFEKPVNLIASLNNLQNRQVSEKVIYSLGEITIARYL